METSPHEIHIWSRCHACGMGPIVGACFRCETCPSGPDIDLCSSCHDKYQAGYVTHPIDTMSDESTAKHHFMRAEGESPGNLTDWLGIWSPSQPDPQLPRKFLVRPEFRYGRESSFGGYGFIIHFEGRNLLLTALHVMDEIIKRLSVDTTGRNSLYTGKELAAYVNSVQLYDVRKARWMLHELGGAGPMVVLPNARTGDSEPSSYRDIAAFLLPTLNALDPLELADEEPKPGDPVWLATAIPDQVQTRRAVCVEKTRHSLVFRYEEAKEIPKHSSGAPILNRRGQLVGINTGFGRFSGHEFGHANPSDSIRMHLQPALSIVAR